MAGPRAYATALHTGSCFRVQTDTVQGHHCGRSGQQDSDVGWSATTKNTTCRLISGLPVADPDVLISVTDATDDNSFVGRVWELAEHLFLRKHQKLAELLTDTSG